MQIDSAGEALAPEITSQLESRYQSEDRLFVASYKRGLGRGLIVVSRASVDLYKNDRKIDSAPAQIFRSEIRSALLLSPADRPSVDVAIQCYDTKDTNLLGLTSGAAMRLMQILDPSSVRVLQQQTTSQSRETFSDEKLGSRVLDLTIRHKGALLGTRVRVFNNGYISFGSGNPEKLLKATIQDETKTKTALGRGIGFVATAGLNMDISKLRGHVYVGIVTESQSRSFTIEMPQPSVVEELHAFVATANALVSTESVARTPEPSGSNMFANSPTIAEQLRQLLELKEQGALTEEEFSIAKARLLQG